MASVTTFQPTRDQPGNIGVHGDLRGEIIGINTAIISKSGGRKVSASRFL